MPIERHSMLYFDGGDIALSAADTPGTNVTQLFRVHRLYLSHSSDIFRDMFVVATSSMDTGEYDGVPLLHLPHDNAQDLASLLDVIYNPTHLHERLASCPKADTPLQLSGLARIARKYMVQDIAETIVGRVQRDWPTDLQAWDIHRERLKITANSRQDVWNDTMGDFPEPVSAILLALDHDTINPAALYKLLITPLEAQWKEQQSVNTDRTRCTQRFSSAWRKDLKSPSARWSLLDRHELMAVLRLRDEFHSKVGDTMKVVHLYFSTDDSLSARCRAVDPRPCREARAALANAFWRNVYTDWTGHTDVLEVFSAGNLLKDWADALVCPSCMSDSVTSLAAYRYHIWDDLSLLWKKHLQGL